MPEAITAEPPATTEAPAINPKLKALFDIKVAEPEPEIEPAAPPVKPPDKPEAPPAAAPEAKKPDTKKDDITLRLAPDFAKVAAESAPIVAAAPDADLVELNQAIADAPTPKAKADLTKFRDQLATLKKENTTLKTRPAAPAEDSETRTLLGAIQKERDELLEKVERANLFDSPKFQREHLIPRQKSFDRLQNIVKESGADPAAIQRAISLSGKPRIDALDEIRAEIGSEMLKGQFDRLVEDIDAKTAEINEKARNAKQTSQELRQAEIVSNEERTSQAIKEFEGLLSSARRDAAENIMPELFTKVDNPDFAWWNDAIDRDDKVAREALIEATPQKAVYAAVFASKLGTVLEMWRAERKSNQAKDQEIAELKGAEPTLTAERTPAKEDTEATDANSIVARLRSGAYKK